ncbi:hypothetical protein C4D60_Mb04t23980 [Musa balbisiana]|uniref:Uncharacterized protein n=1 Tax=Musa balbisiana TaxID=52838 RepID=A0A4S8KEA1_MUSBA|nr:hypothetical protein C4D60_Mb04t23980 [Musa balbisiana]
MVAGSSEEQRQRRVQQEIRDMISTLTDRLTALGRSVPRSEAKGQEAGDANPGLGVITLAGDNKGASMKADMEELGDAHGGLYSDDGGMCTYTNSNYQAVNNSILLGGSCAAKDPGVHVVISEYVEEDDDDADDDDDEEERHRKKEKKKKKKEEKEKKKKEKKKKKDKDKHEDRVEEEEEEEEEKQEKEKKKKDGGGETGEERQRQLQRTVGSGEGGTVRKRNETIA